MSHVRLASFLVGLTLAACGNNTSGFLPSVFDVVTVSVVGTGDGSGVVSASASAVNIACQITNGVSATSGCATTFNDIGGGGVFTLAARPAEDSEFVSWTGCTSQVESVCTLAFSAGENPVFRVLASFRKREANGGLYGVNLLRNPGFETAVEVGTLPSAVGAWRGDFAASIVPPTGISPLEGTRVLQFQRTGPVVASLTGESSQQWQLVDVSSIAADIDAGRVRATAKCWFASVPGDAQTDRRFDLRVGAFTGSPSSFPASYAAPQGVRLADPTTSVLTGTVGAWLQAELSFILPAGTRYLAVEIYAFENVFNDAVDPEFDGHFADDAELVLRRSE